MNNRIIAALMISAASIVAVSAATAADMPVKAVPAVPLAVATGFFGYIEGMYVVEPGDAAGQFPNVFPNHSPAASPGHGFGGAFLIGYRFAGPWDVAVGMHHTRFTSGAREPFPICGANTFNQMTKPQMTSADGNVGYNVSTDGSATRIHVGVRYARWKHHLDDTCNNLHNDAETNAIGPRIGFDHSFKAGSNLTVIMGGSSSLLFADVENTVRTGAGALVVSGKDDRLVFHAGAHLALGWQIAPLINLAAGYKFDIWHGMISEQAGFDATTVGRGRSNVIEHGPFVRASYNFGVR